MGCVASRASEAIGRHMPEVLAEANVGQHIGQIMALATHGIGTIRAQVRIGEPIGYQPTWRRRLAELVVALQNVGVQGAMRTVRSIPAELAGVIAVVTIRTEEAATYGARRGSAILVEHIQQKTGLWQVASAVMHDRVAGGGRRTEFWNHIQRIGGRNSPYG